MHFFLDCEFDGFGGKLLSLALAPRDRASDSLYLLASDASDVQDEWVRQNVVPFYKTELPQPAQFFEIGRAAFGPAISSYLSEFSGGMPHIVVDWPDDLRYFCESLIVSPGQMVGLPAFSSQLVRVDAYPTTLPNAVQHNALWDALALREVLTGAS